MLLPGKAHGWRSLVGCGPRGCEESGTTERLHFHFSLSWIGEGNGSPLQCSCLENPRDGRAWWAAVYGVAQSWTQLKRLSSSNSSSVYMGLRVCLSYPLLPTTLVHKTFLYTCVSIPALYHFSGGNLSLDAVVVHFLLRMPTVADTQVSGFSYKQVTPRLW